MRFIKISDKTKKIVKFEANLLLGTCALALVVYFGTRALIYKTANTVVDYALAPLDLK